MKESETEEKKKYTAHALSMHKMKIERAKEEQKQCGAKRKKSTKKYDECEKIKQS